MGKKRVLFVGGGRRVELAERFKARDYDVFGYEISAEVPLADVAKGIILGYKWDNPFLQEHILETSVKYNMDLVLPLQDRAVVECSQIKFPSYIHYVGSSHETAMRCFDKREFGNSFRGAELEGHYPWPEALRNAPWIVKPRFGFGSKNIYVIRYTEEWQDWLNEHKMQDYISQKYIEGDEYSVDSYFDRRGCWVDSVPRIRVRVGSGEVITSETIKDMSMVYLAKYVGEMLGTVGPTNTQIIQEHNTGKLFVTEVNARFGGGFTFSMKAGLDAISLIERDYLGLTEFAWKPLNWQEHLILERSYKDHYFYGSKNNSFRLGRRSV